MTTVSATVTLYNRRHIIERTIDSILAQTRPVDEIVIVDDGSSDGSAEHVRDRYGDQVRIVQQENQGVGSARARCIEEARCDWIAFLDSDDTWSPDRNEKMVNAVETLPADVPWLFGDTTEIHDDKTLSLFETHGLHPTEHLQIWDDPMPTQYPFQFTMLQSSLIRRDMAIGDRIYERGMRGHDDLVMGFRAASKYRIASLNEPVTQLYRTSDLAGSSVEQEMRETPEYYEARMIAFGAAAAAGRPGHWGEAYANAIRGLLLYQSTPDTKVRRLAISQFKHTRLDLRAIAFLGAAMFGQPGLKAWTGLKQFRTRAA